MNPYPGNDTESSGRELSLRDIKESISRLPFEEMNKILVDFIDELVRQIKIDRQNGEHELAFRRCMTLTHAIVALESVHDAWRLAGSFLKRDH